MKIKYKGKDYVIPKPFDQCFFGKDPTKEMTIFNRFSDETFSQSAKLPAFAQIILWSKLPSVTASGINSDFGEGLCAA